MQRPLENPLIQGNPPNPGGPFNPGTIALESVCTSILPHISSCSNWFKIQYLWSCTRRDKHYTYTQPPFCGGITYTHNIYLYTPNMIPTPSHKCTPISFIVQSTHTASTVYLLSKHTHTEAAWFVYTHKHTHSLWHGIQ